jgi:hypothetical protein
MTWNPTTTRARHRFVVQEDADGQPFIMLELLDGKELPVLYDGLLTFDLPKGTPYKRAQEIASFLTDNIVSTAYTGTRK